MLGQRVAGVQNKENGLVKDKSYKTRKKKQMKKTKKQQQRSEAEKRKQCAEKEVRSA